MAKTEAPANAKVDEIDGVINELQGMIDSIQQIFDELAKAAEHNDYYGQMARETLFEGEDSEETAVRQAIDLLREYRELVK